MVKGRKACNTSPMPDRPSGPASNRPRTDPGSAQDRSKADPISTYTPPKNDPVRPRICPTRSHIDLTRPQVGRTLTRIDPHRPQLCPKSTCDRPPRSALSRPRSTPDQSALPHQPRSIQTEAGCQIDPRSQIEPDRPNRARSSPRSILNWPASAHERPHADFNSTLDSEQTTTRLRSNIRSTPNRLWTLARVCPCAHSGCSKGQSWRASTLDLLSTNAPGVILVPPPRAAQIRWRS